MSFSPFGLALGPLEAAINRALDYDPGSRTALAELAGKTLAIECTLPPLSAMAAFGTDGRISLFTPPEQAPGVRLKGNPVALAVLLSRADDTYSFAHSGVTIEGDQDVLIRIGGILGQLDIDWEQALAELIGDTPAHMAGEAVRGANGWLREAADRSRSGVAEYVREESDLTVSNTEARGWYDDVGRLSADTDRLNARINHLKSLLKKPGDEKTDGPA